jgi:putative tricarboxylic transport membrane protein
VRLNPRYRALLPYLLVLAVAAVLTWKAMHFGFTPRGDRPGPDVWPRAILALAIVTCLVRIAVLLRRPGDRDPVSLADVLDNPMQSVEADQPPPRRYPLLLATGIALTIAYVALLSTLGFFCDTVLYITAMARAGRYRRWPVIAAVALAGALVFMFVFMKIVYLSLPLGVGPFEAISLALMRLMGIR